MFIVKSATRRAIVVVIGAGMALVLQACGGSSSSSQPPASSGADVSTHKTDQGTVLVDSDGMSLYRYMLDKNGKSACTGTCAQSFPPATAATSKPTGGSDVTAEVGVITRPDGTKQLTIDGWPLYTAKVDTAPGQTHGQGSGGQWYLVSRSGSKIASRVDTGGY